MTQKLIINNQNFVMHPSGALFWEEEHAVLISDVHLGKISHFRKFGAAVPQNAVQQNYRLLEEVMHLFRPKKIYFLGDLFHSAINKEWLLFKAWVANTTSKITLIAGNHDIISPLQYEAIGIAVIPELIKASFLLTHHPETRAGLFNFSGHIHPAIKLKGKGRQSLRLACFFKTETQLIFPAFGTFTGSHVLTPKATDEVYAITENEVIFVSK